MKFHIRTFGCQMNINESEIMRGLLSEQELEWTENPEQADVLIINSCSVREKAEKKMYAAIGTYNKLKKSKPGIIIGVGGCSAAKEKEKILKKYSGVNFVFGTRNVVDIANLVERARKDKNQFIDMSDKLDSVSWEIPKVTGSDHHAWITIQYGCNKYCTYCIVPYTRGLEKSRTVEDIVKEIKDYASKGFKEVTLLGQNVDSYGKDYGDGKPKLDKLIEEAAKAEGIERIWFTTSYPSDITDELIEKVSEVKKAAKYFHLPAQAGSDSVLKRMNRRYTSEEFINLVNKIKEKVKGVTITSDFIVGFPGESDEEFEETYKIVEKCRFEKINIAEYSTREGTIASKFLKDDISKEVKNKRLTRLMDLQKKINKEENNKYIGRTVRVIQEGKNKQGLFYGRTLNNKMIIFESEDTFTGLYADIKIKRSSAGPLYGDIVITQKDKDFNSECDPTFE
ncbi:MAG TPA: tRNA (N6-isopentenyl adenosine(37)-C2)-methylthiotransferase MiaB [Tepiditoga sp.]|nr:tRNA (N6-isopentenyl adenosine(37)-C2)-methylthiotransferase MiaB [Tepiditoga sp.]